MFFENTNSEQLQQLEAKIRQLPEDLNTTQLDNRDAPRRVRFRKSTMNRNDAFGLERIIGDRNLFEINYLAQGLASAKPVCRIRIRDSGGKPAGFGTGFLVAPGLLLTNNHVLRSKDSAAHSTAEFEVELDSFFVEKKIRKFHLRPDQLFFSDKALDFTFVRVAPRAADDFPLAQYGHLPLIQRTGKAINGEFVSIIQHPEGKLKKLVIRDNQIVTIGECDEACEDVFIHYTSDTEPGSSGAPVFNDQWQVVALHHKAIPRFIGGSNDILSKSGEPWNERDGIDEIEWMANEGIRISAIFSTLYKHSSRDVRARSVLNEIIAENRQGTRLGISLQSSSEPVDEMPEAEAFEATEFDGVSGYDPDFLSKKVPLPEVVGGWADDVAILEEGGTELAYEHFSVVMSESRRLAFFVAVNIDGGTLKRPTKSPSWRTDSRLAKSLQIDNNLYRRTDGEDFDIQRGHLVRRLDPVWGSMTVVNRAVDHTYHYTNAAPQGKGFNNTVWGDLEDFILKRAIDTDHRVTVFSGPVFDDDNDPFYRSNFPDGPYQIPMEYWKVVVFEKLGGQLSATAYKQSQFEVRDWVEADLTTHGFSPISDARRAMAQLSIAKLEELTSIDFGDLKRFDPLHTAESSRQVRQFLGLEDIIL